MQTAGSSNGESVSVEKMVDKNAEATKEKLLQEVRDLRSIINQCEWKLNTQRFKDVERAIQRPSDSTIPRFGVIPNVEVQLQNDLYRFAGLHCVSFKREELVFNFTSTKDVYALQIFIKGGKGNLGKWVMPMSINMNQILTKTPIDELKNIGAFVKNCKHNIDCYVTRQEQFLSLKEHISNMKNCTLESNMGYTHVILEIYGIQNGKDDKYMNLIVYLLYHSEEARPYKIEIETTDKNKLSDEMKQRLKAWFKEFKISDLRTAFDKILMDNNSAFTWIQADDTDSPLELNDISSSDEEGFLMELQSDRKKSLRKAKRKRELQKKWKERKKQKSVASNITPATASSDSSNSLAAKALHTDKPQYPIKRKRTRKTTSLLERQEEINRNIPEEETPMNKLKIGLKQTKLNFHINQTINSDSTNQSSLIQLKQHTKHNSKKKTAKLFTSTPLHRNIKDKALSLSFNLDIDNITNIEPLPKRTTNQLNESKDKNFPKSKNTPEAKIHNRLRSSKLSPRLSPTKDDQRFTRSMKKI